MNELMFSGYGVDIIKRNDEYYIRYDNETIAMYEIESKISFYEAL